MNEKILFITTGLWKGGAETQLLKLARFLTSQGKEVMIISLKPIDGFHLDYKKEGITVLFLANWGKHFFSNCIALYKAVKNFKANIVIAFMFIAIIFARLLKLRFRFTLISSIRTSVLPKKWSIPFRLTSGLDDDIVYNSHASKSNFERRNLVGKEGVVINNGISIPVLKQSDPHNSDFVWICIAHFKWNKDYLTLFKAIALIKERNFRVDIVGNLNNEVWPFKVIEDLKIQKNVRLLGFKSNTSEYLENADAFVLSSFLEGMPNAILEAMSFSKPVVASAIDGNNELLSNSNCGLLFEQGNEKDLSEKMIQIMELSDLQRRALGKRGRTHIESNFSEEKVMGDWFELINQYSGRGRVILRSS